MTRRAAIAVAALTLTCAVGAAVSSASAQNSMTATCTVGGQSLPCSTPWFTAPVQIVWQADPPPTSTSGCELGIAYSYTSDAATSLSCQATWGDGSQVALSFPFHLEASSPSATAIPARPPDAGGWYNHPVAIGFSGSAFSGITGCSPAVVYSGPDTAGTTVAGACADSAGKSAGTSIALRYDAAAPAITLTAAPLDGSVSLTWAASSGPAPLSAVSVTRTPPSGGAAAVMSSALGGSVSDTAVHNGDAYTYTVAAVDQAGNTSSRSVTVTPGPRVLTPAVGVRVATPPVLTWTAVRRADYYNVQVFHGGKVLSAWPRTARLRLHRTWRFHGRRHRLTPGRYRWYVWPGFGRPARARYGKLIGSGTFVVR